MNVEKRMKIEKQVIKAALLALTKAGFYYRLWDGEDFLTGISNQPDYIMEDIHSCDEEWIFVYDCEQNKIGSIFLVYGNDGWDVLADHSLNLEDVLKPVYQLCDQIEEENQ